MSNNDERYLLQALEFEGTLRACLQHFADRESELALLLQETYVRLLAAGSVEGSNETSVLTLALTLSRQVGADWMRQRGMSEERIDSAHAASSLQEVTPSDTFADNHTRMDLLLRFVRALTDPSRQVFTLRKVYGYSQKEIVSRLGIAADFVEQCLITAARGSADALFARRPARGPPLPARFRAFEARMGKADEISSAAARWLIRLEFPPAVGSWDQFQSWLDQEPRHRAAFIRLRMAWTHLDLLKHLRPLDGRIDPDLLDNGGPGTASAILTGRGLRGSTDRLAQIPRTRQPARLVRLAAVGFAIVGATVLGWLGYQHVGWTTYRAGIGARVTIALEDGTTVDLNTGTRLRARIGNARRDIALERGEALFRVTSDPRRPFYVFAATTIVRSLGTEFSVRMLDDAADHVEILLAAGRIAVATRSNTSELDSISTESAPQLSAVAAIDSSPAGLRARSMSEEELLRKLAWMDGHLAFQGESLAEAVQEFNRYNRRQLAIADPDLLRLRVGGIFRTTDPDSFIAALRKSFGIRTMSSPRTPDLQLVGDSHLREQHEE